jgi:hypothetical protein
MRAENRKRKPGLVALVECLESRELGHITTSDELLYSI